MIRSSPRLGLTLTLGSAQTLAWASSYYLPAILAVPMARELEISSSWVFAAFSVALLLTAMLGPSVGRLIDQQGGRGVLMASNAVLAFGLVIMALSQGVLSLMLAWLITGVGMAMGLYDAAFATLGRLLGRSARSSITGVTLLAGFASTIGWPLTALLENEFGWRVACGAWAILHIVIGLPLNARLPKAGDSVNHSNDEKSAPSPERPRLAMVLLAYVFAAGWFVSTAMAAHLPRLLQETGVSLSVAVAAAALVGPAQVAARLGEFALLRRLHPLVAARVATTLHPLGAALLATVGMPAAGFALLHGAGNGMMTIASGTLPLALFGPKGFGQRQGLIIAPARAAQAFAPLLFGLLIEQNGAGALWLTTGLMLAACLALVFIRVPRARV
ncbi:MULTISPECIES: MFS transporter [Halomonadaceae]|uniref:MFS transporter n=2 Tax=Vreelandella TaxID=3137766 RepID=A0A7Z0LWB0_9GAMM|nr:MULTISPECIES: MFS transporter [Halomonas]NYS79804.1 MFS transporter [Halomonas glaciei]|tara:strand:+ start:6143 stop:7306 length:1164 start_codon:yes stop_codon:yes gene_type:complete